VANMGAIEEAHVDEFLLALDSCIVTIRETRRRRAVDLRVV